MTQKQKKLLIRIIISAVFIIGLSFAHIGGVMRFF